MTREDIIRMGRQAGAFIELAQEKDLLWLERFAAHVAKHTLANIDPSSFMTWQEGYEVGKQTEREACAKVCDDHCGWTPRMIESTIRARGNVAVNDTSQERVDETTKQRHDAPPQRTWVGLTDDEIWGTISRIGTSDLDVNPYAKLADARAIEAKLKEKNT